MLSKKDFQKLEDKFVTKDEWKSSVKELIEYFQISQADLKKELREEIVIFKDQILTEIIKLREDIAIVVGYRSMLENHELRIEKLEAKNIPA